MEDSYPTRPEELNRLLKFRMTFSWVTLILIFIAMSLLIIWSSVTSIPVYIDGYGVLMNRSRVRPLFCNTDGIIETINATEWEKVSSGDVLAGINPDTSGNAGIININAPDDVTIIQKWIYPSLYVREGDLLFTVEKENFYGKPFVKAFVSLDKVKMIEPGMEALISVPGAGRKGFIKGRVGEVSRYPMSSELMFYELGNKYIIKEIREKYQNREEFLADVTLFISEDKDGNYEWTGERPDGVLKTGTPCRCFIIGYKQTFLEELLPWSFQVKE